MPLILSIDTAQTIASLCLSRDEEVLDLSLNDNQKDHATWMHTGIKNILAKTGQDLENLEAIAVSIGPGSYTGLRIGLSAAKGLCFALQIPLIAIGTLEMMAFAVKEEATEWICPLIDARRMEVYMALYDKQITQLQKPQAMVIDENSFVNLLSNHNLTFCGSGRKKLQLSVSHPHASFTGTEANAFHLSCLAIQYFERHEFADLAYIAPLYVKEFHTTSHK